ncbi:hypothetical protein RPMA_13795 [Tardiphaga alba]|uniref:Uncharacterized protein n=2 Tax=Tardiphaga alba TaxID=340268 RepID=A0ABX8AFT3_9BRAD|nr:hypothetical protein RPMA_13795 [Tardiphaga alba]
MPARLLAAHLADGETGWSMGSFGAIGEFTRDTDEPAISAIDDTTASIVTPRGGVRLIAHDDQRLIASESLTRDSWSQRVALCLPQDRCAMNERRVLTEIGPDGDALRKTDRDGVLFDLGLGCLQVDVCVRITGADTVAALRRAVGTAVFVPDSAALPILMAANPHRVFLTRLGRLEVFQSIPPPTGRSPDGPHTHILPKLLAAGRTHAATEPLPGGWVPCAHFYPAHPQRDQLGRPHAFEPTSHDAFQALLTQFGVPDLVALKHKVLGKIAANAPASSEADLGGRHGRATLRIALRQLLAAGETAPALQEWLDAFDHRGTDDSVDPMEQLHRDSEQP